MIEIRVDPISSDGDTRQASLNGIEQIKFLEITALLQHHLPRNLSRRKKTGGNAVC